MYCCNGTGEMCIVVTTDFVPKKEIIHLKYSKLRNQSIIYSV